MNKLIIWTHFLVTISLLSGLPSFAQNTSKFPKESFAAFLGREVNVLYWRSSDLISEAIERMDENDILNETIQNNADRSDLWVFILDDLGQVKNLPEGIKNQVSNLNFKGSTAFLRLDVTVANNRKVQIKIINLEALAKYSEQEVLCRISTSVYRDIRFYLVKKSQSKITTCERYSKPS